MGKRRKSSIRCKTSKRQNKHQREYQISKQKQKNKCGDKDVVTEYRMPLNQLIDKNGLSSDNIYDELLHKNYQSDDWSNKSVYSTSTNLSGNSLISDISLEKQRIAQSVLFGSKTPQRSNRSNGLTNSNRSNRISNTLEQFKFKLEQIEKAKKKANKKKKQSSSTSTTTSPTRKGGSRFKLAKKNIVLPKRNDNETDDSKQANNGKSRSKSRRKRSQSSLRSKSKMSLSSFLSDEEDAMATNNNNNINDTNERKNENKEKEKDDEDMNLINLIVPEHEILVLDNLDNKVTSKILCKIISKLIIARQETLETDKINNNNNNSNNIFDDANCVCKEMITILESSHNIGTKCARIDFTFDKDSMIANDDDIDNNSNNNSCMIEEMNENDAQLIYKRVYCIKELLDGKKLFGKKIIVTTMRIDDLSESSDQDI